MQIILVSYKVEKKTKPFVKNVLSKYHFCLLESVPCSLVFWFVHTSNQSFTYKDDEVTSRSRANVYQHKANWRWKVNEWVRKKICISNLQKYICKNINSIFAQTELIYRSYNLTHLRLFNYCGEQVRAGRGRQSQLTLRRIYLEENILCK